MFDVGVVNAFGDHEAAALLSGSTREPCRCQRRASVLRLLIRT